MKNEFEPYYKQVVTTRKKRKNEQNLKIKLKTGEIIEENYTSYEFISPYYQELSIGKELKRVETSTIHWEHGISVYEGV